MCACVCCNNMHRPTGDAKPGWVGCFLFAIIKYLREQGLNTVQTLFFLELPPLVLASLHQWIYFAICPSQCTWCCNGDFPNLSLTLQVINFLIPFFCRSLTSLGSIHSIAFLLSKSSLALYFQFTPTTEQKPKQYPFVNQMTCLSLYSKAYG